MHIRFSDIDDAFIKEAVEQGFYLSETELVRDAVRRMRESHKSQSHRLREAVEAGRKSFEGGNAVDYTPALMKEIKNKAIKKAENGEGYNKNETVPH